MSELTIGPRARLLNRRTPGSGSVIYWVSRDQRAADNWALAEACELARAADSFVVAVFCLRSRCGNASRRHYEFMLEGLTELQQRLRELGIPFLLRHGEPAAIVPRFVEQIGAGTVVCDFAPLVPARLLRSRLAEALPVPLVEVDARNIVPAWIAAEKQLYAAHHLRKRYERLLPEFRDALPPSPGGQRADPALFERFDQAESIGFVEAGDHGPRLSITPGERAARDVLDDFITTRLDGYATRRGNPSLNGQSGLSPYLHFGQLSAQRAVVEVLAAARSSEDAAEFLDEAVVWRELADNFCFFNPAYATIGGFPNWARESLESHAADAREIIYSQSELEAADTHDDLWNAAQTELVQTGKMHNYMRMYWAKKILEWSESPAEALRVTVLLNDRYSIDGRESNGYAGIAWSIGGVHDRPWPERPVFGKIRYMNANGAKRKFDVDAYIRRAAGQREIF